MRTPQADGEQQRTVTGSVVSLVDEILLKEHQCTVDAILVVRHPVALADAGVRDLFGGRPFAGAGFGEGFGFALRILCRFIAVASPDVPAYALVPAVHLVGTRKVHLARADRLVAVAREVSGHGHGFARHLVVVFEGAGVVRIKTGKETLTRRHADGRRRIGVAEVGALVDEPVEGWRPNMRIPFNRHDIGAVFIVDKQQDMGLFFGHGLSLGEAVVSG